MRSALLVAVFTLLAIPAHAQSNDERWEPWLGCWTLAVDNLRDRPAPEGPPQRAPRPSAAVEGAPRVCVTRTPGGARFETTVGGQPAIDQTILADAAGHPLNEDECSGTQRTEWSKNGLRLFSSAEIRCKSDEGPRRASGFSLIAPNGDWVDIQTVSIGGRETVRVKRYYRATDSPRSNRPTVVSSRLTFDEVIDASTKVPASALEAALVESNSGFDLTAKKVKELNFAGVPERVIDLIVALSYPEKFVIQRVAQVSSGGQSTYVRDPFLLGYGYGSPFYYDYYYGSPYYYEPFGYRGYAAIGYGTFSESRGGGSVGAAPGSASGVGRVVNGQGYTRVVPRDSSTNTSSNTTRTSSTSGTTSSASSGNSGSSSSSSGSSGGSSGGGSTSPAGSTSGGGSSDSGRTAVPR